MDCWRAERQPDWLEVDYADLVADPESARRRFASYVQENGVTIDPRPATQYATKTLNKFSAHGEIHGKSVQRWRRYENFATEL